MGSGPQSFKERDLMRAIRTAIKAGLPVAGFEVNPQTGNIIVHTGKPADDLTRNPWDEKL